jgi:hypothetical protein
VFLEYLKDTKQALLSHQRRPLTRLTLKQMIVGTLSPDVTRLCKFRLSANDNIQFDSLTNNVIG